MSSFYDCAFAFPLTVLVYGGFCPVSFDIGDVSSQLVSARVRLFS